MKKKLEEHGDYTSIANCQTKIPAIFEEYLEFSAVPRNGFFKNDFSRNPVFFLVKHRYIPLSY